MSEAAWPHCRRKIGLANAMLDLQTDDRTCKHAMPDLQTDDRTCKHAMPDLQTDDRTCKAKPCTKKLLPPGRSGIRKELSRACFSAASLLSSAALLFRSILLLLREPQLQPICRLAAPSSRCRSGAACPRRKRQLPPRRLGSGLPRYRGRGRRCRAHGRRS